MTLKASFHNRTCFLSLNLFAAYKTIFTVSRSIVFKSIWFYSLIHMKRTFFIYFFSSLSDDSSLFIRQPIDWITCLLFFTFFSLCLAFFLLFPIFIPSSLVSVAEFSFSFTRMNTQVAVGSFSLSFTSWTLIFLWSTFSIYLLLQIFQRTNFSTANRRVNGKVKSELVRSREREERKKNNKKKMMIDLSTVAERESEGDRNHRAWVMAKGQRHLHQPHGHQRYTITCNLRQCCSFHEWFAFIVTCLDKETTISSHEVTVIARKVKNF